MAFNIDIISLRSDYIMNNKSQPLHYIRKNRKTEAMIYLKENKQKDAQRLLCMFHAADYNYKVLGETTNLDDVKNCDVMIVASTSVLTRDKEEYSKIEEKLNKKEIKIEISGSNGRAEDYIDMILKMSRKGRI